MEIIIHQADGLYKEVADIVDLKTPYGPLSHTLRFDPEIHEIIDARPPKKPNARWSKVRGEWTYPGDNPLTVDTPEAERPSPQSLSASGDRIEQTNQDDWPDLSINQELEAERDEAREVLAVEKEKVAARDARIAELMERLEAAEGPGLLPDLATKMSDYVPNEIRDLMEPGETFAQARKRLSELLNVEKAELRLKRAAGSATEAELKREADVDRLQGLFSKLGEI